MQMQVPLKTSHDHVKALPACTRSCLLRPNTLPTLLNFPLNHTSWKPRYCIFQSTMPLRLWLDSANERWSHGIWKMDEKEKTVFSRGSRRARRYPPKSYPLGAADSWDPGASFMGISTLTDSLTVRSCQGILDSFLAPSSSNSCRPLFLYLNSLITWNT